MRFPQTKNLIFLTILLTPFYWVKFQIFHIPSNILELSILLTFLVWLKNRISLSPAKLPDKKTILLILLIFLGLVSSTFVSQNYTIGLGIIKGWFALPLLFAFVVSQEISNSKITKEEILYCLYFSGLTVAAISLLYFLSGNLTYDHRLKAFYLSPNFLAMYLAPVAIFGFFEVKNTFSKSRFNHYEIFFIISYAVILFSFYLTKSYMAWISAIAGIFLTFFLTQNKKIIFRLLFIFLCLLLLLFMLEKNNPKFQDIIHLQERSSLASRIMIWKSATKILSDHPVFGIGPGNFQDKYLEYQKYFPPYLEWAVPHPHNLYLAFWLYSGITGLIAFLTLISIWLIRHIKKITVNPSLANSALLAIMLYLLIHGLLDTTYWKNDLSLVFWLIFVL